MLRWTQPLRHVSARHTDCMIRCHTGLQISIRNAIFRELSGCLTVGLCTEILIEKFQNNLCAISARLCKSLIYMDSVFAFAKGILLKPA
jgi:hypothetical protein